MFLVVIGIAVGAVLVYATGGTKFVTPHVLYVPVLIGGILFGWRGGVVTGVVAGLSVGPLMPLDVAAALPQTSFGWLIRTGFFVLIGTLAGVSADQFRRMLNGRRDFLASVSHELRTPLTAVFGFAQVLHEHGDEITKEERIGLIADVYRQSAELVRMIDDLLVAARLESGGLNIQSDLVNLEAEAQTVVEEMRERSSGASIRLAKTDEALAVADGLRVRQIIRNLLSNAIRHGGGNVEVELSSSDQHQILMVRDDGPGVPEESIGSIFQPFYTVTRATTTPASLGLGLAVSRELASLMGGQLTYRRVDGHTVFGLELPAIARPVETLQRTQPI
jgi:signal transduction histidine kinase